MARYTAGSKRQIPLDRIAAIALFWIYIPIVQYVNGVDEGDGKNKQSLAK